MKKINYNSISLFFLPFLMVLFLSPVSAQLNAEVIGDAEISGDLKIKYSNPDNSDINMLILERFQPAFNSPPFFIPSSNNNWSLELGPKPFFPLSDGNDLILKYNGETKLTFEDNIGEINRPQSGSADLLPYAYGHIEASSTNIIAGTNNYTIVRTNYGADIIFNEDIARQLVINATPTIERSQVILLRKNVTGTAVDEIVIGYPFQGETGTNAQATINVFLNDSSGNPRNDASFSFIAYKPN